MFWETDFETWRKGVRLRFWVQGYHGICSPVFCVPAELVQIFKQTHKSRNKRKVVNVLPTHTDPASQLGYSTSPSLPALLTSLSSQPFAIYMNSYRHCEVHRAAFQSRMGSELQMITCLVPLHVWCWGLVASEQPQRQEALCLKISAFNSIWSNSYKLVGDMVVWGGGHQIKFTPEKKCSVWCSLGLSDLLSVCHPHSWCSCSSCMRRQRVGGLAKPRGAGVPSSCQRKVQITSHLCALHSVHRVFVQCLLTK